MPSFSLSVGTTLVLLIIFISTELCAQIVKGAWVHCGGSWQLKFWCRTGTLLLKSSIAWRKSLTQRLFSFVSWFLEWKHVLVCYAYHININWRTLLQSFASPLNQVQSRIWLMHWSLFIFFNHDNGRTQIIDLFNQDKYAMPLLS